MNHHASANGFDARSSTDKTPEPDILSVLSVQNEIGGNGSDPLAQAPMPKPNEAQIRAFCDLLFSETAGCLELRIIGYKNGTAKPRNAVGFFRSVDAIAKAAMRYHGQANIYIGLNARLPALLHAQKADCLVADAAGAKDNEVLYRRWLLIDIDTIRPNRRVAATRDELAESHRTFQAIDQFLRGRGIEAIGAMSGNGWHLLLPTIEYPVEVGAASDSKTDPFALLLRWLARKFKNEHAEVDTTTFNSGRVCKLYGIAAIKGGNTKERPFRTAVFAPPSSPLARFDVLSLFKAEIAAQLAHETDATGRERATRTGSGKGSSQWHQYTGNIATLDIVSLFRDCGMYVRSVGSGKHAVICPWSTNHTTGSDGDTSTVIFEPEHSRWPGFKCQHNHCSHCTLEHVLEYFGSETVSAYCRQKFGRRGTSEYDPGGTEAKTRWPARKALPQSLGPAPAMPIDMIPEPLRAWVADTAERIGVLYECVAVPAVAALAIVIGRKIGIFPKRHDFGWIVVPSVLWTAVIARSGAKKSAAINAAIKPLSLLEKAARSDHVAVQRQNRSREKILAAKIDSILTDIKQKSKKGRDTTELEADLEALTKELDELNVSEKRYTTQDSTVERLSELLSRNPSGMGVIVDELVTWIRGLERKGHEAARGFYLKAWDGTQSDTIDRIGRGTVHVEALFVVLLGGIQPDVIRPYIRDCVQGGKENDGLLQRFQMMIIPDTSEPRPLIDRAPDTDAYRRVVSIFEKIDQIDGTRFAGGNTTNSDIPAIHFSDDAQDLFNIFAEALEQELCRTDAPAVESHLAKLRSTMPALALVFHVLSCADGQAADRGVSLEAASLALDWVDFLKEHMLRVYGLPAHGDAKAAQALARKITEGKVKDGMTIREIYRACWADLATKAAVNAAVAVLEEHHWLRTSDSGKPSAGRPSTRIYLHPDFHTASKEGNDHV